VDALRLCSGNDRICAVHGRQRHDARECAACAGPTFVYACPDYLTHSCCECGTPICERHSFWAEGRGACCMFCVVGIVGDANTYLTRADFLAEEAARARDREGDFVKQAQEEVLV